MQKYSHPPCPTELESAKDSLIIEYQKTQKPVWLKAYIKVSLFNMTFGKCIYCECCLNQESKYLEVEHFHAKSSYPEKIVDWENLLPSCRRCNVKKSNHDVLREPIVNPSCDNPKEHLAFSHYRFFAKTEKGRSTIDVVDLNDYAKLTVLRFKIGEKTFESLNGLIGQLQSYEPGESIGKRNKIVKRMTALMSQAKKEEGFCTTVATVLKQDNAIDNIKKLAIMKNIWDDELEELYLNINNLSY